MCLPPIVDSSMPGLIPLLENSMAAADNVSFAPILPTSLLLVFSQLGPKNKQKNLITLFIKKTEKINYTTFKRLEYIIQSEFKISHFRTPIPTE